MSQSKMPMLAQSQAGVEQSTEVERSKIGTVIITAAEFKPGMVWVGESPILITAVEEGETRPCMPWDAGRESTAEPKMMTMVIIKGDQANDGFGIYQGTWKVQPDSPCEVILEGGTVSA